MSSNIVDQITLECLMNKELYNKLVANKKNVISQKTDQIAYRDRILALTEELFRDSEDDDPEACRILMQDVQYAFDNYVKTCVRHFKIADEGFKEKEEDVSLVKEDESNISDDVRTLKSIKYSSGTLDGFVNYVH